MTKMIKVKQRLDEQFKDFKEQFEKETFDTDRVLGIHNDKLNKIDGRMDEQSEKISRLIMVCKKQQGVIDALLEDSHPSLWSKVKDLLPIRSSESD